MTSNDEGKPDIVMRLQDQVDQNGALLMEAAKEIARLRRIERAAAELLERCERDLPLNFRKKDTKEIIDLLRPAFNGEG